jgi:hypothetical protein
MKELYINGKLVALIYDNDTQVSNEDGELYDVSEYIYETLSSNIQYDAVDYNNTIQWKEVN